MHEPIKTRAYVITGASRGLGDAFFEMIKEQNVLVFLLSRKFSEMQKNDAQAYPMVHLIEHDFSDRAQLAAVQSFIDALISAKPHEIIFINNAAMIEPLAQIGDLNSDLIQQAIDVNFTTPVIIVNALIKALQQTTILLKLLHISSGAAKFPIAGWSIYCATKAAADMYFRTLEKEADHTKITVQSIDPGVMDTNMQQVIRGANFPDRNAFVALKQQGQLHPPVDVARKILQDYQLL